MTSPSMFPDEVTIRRPGASADRYNNAGFDWATATETTVMGQLDESTPAEDTRDREQASVTGTVFLEPGTDVRPTDRLVIYGQAYEIVGLPQTWRRYQQVRFISCRVKRAVG